MSRAIASVLKQRCSARINHLIVIDDCKDTLAALGVGQAEPRRRVYFVRRESTEFTGPERLGRLRNIGVACGDSKWVAFLDDDNAWERDHLQTLLDTCMRSGTEASHSYMRLFRSDGEPFLEESVPWILDGVASREEYRRRQALGMVLPESNVVRDRADPLDKSDGLRTVDAGEWLLARRLLSRYPLVEAMSVEDLHRGDWEDDVMLRTLLSRNVKIACTERATLHYYLGGYSTSGHV